MDGESRTTVDRWKSQDRPYRRARRLQDGLAPTAPAFCEAIARPLFDRDGPALAGDLVAARREAPGLSLVSLNVWGLIALWQHEWDTAQALASEVTARDHHDLLGQRIQSAALARSDTLETPVDAWLSDRVCTAPFEEMETRENGDIHFCCSAWQPVPIGRVGDAEDPWASERADEIRRSVTEGDFSHCSRWHCPRIAGRRLRRKTAVPDPVTPSGPKRVILSHDRSCNLACPSCRSGMIQLNHAASAKLDALYDRQLRPLLRHAAQVKVTGSGDPFGSRHLRRVVADIAAEPSETRRLQLHTNGVLLDEKAWDALDLWGSVASIWISIDAARAETYDRLRGGDFHRLMDNLAFLGDLRRLGELPFLRLDMVVQRDNYDEVPELVDLANRVGADGIYLLRLRNWGTYTPQAFRALDVCAPDHPEHDRLLDRLADPRLGSPGVELGSMQPLRERALARGHRCGDWF